MGDRPIVFHPSLSLITGNLSAGLFLGQALYWQNRVPPGRDGWWWHSQNEWTEETTLARRECDTVRKLLKKLGLIEVEQRGFPKKTWYRVDLDRLDVLLTDLQVRRELAAAGDVDDVPVSAATVAPIGATETTKNAKLRPQKTPDVLYTEITTEKHIGAVAPIGSTATADQPRQLRPQQTRPGQPVDAADLVELGEYVAGEVAAAQGRAVSESMVSGWLSQLRILVASGLAVDAIRAGWDFGRGHTAYGVAVMTPGGFNRHHEGLIAEALDARKAGQTGTGGQAACKGVDGGGCDQPATMGSSGRNTHCGDCFEAQADADMARLLESGQ